ncbi:TetR/AcrR family transcriptional regulator [Sphingorhabdus sp. Alg239-R122]|uniref:TetR/AcrR family transcriptional regulator n=1 Tax=Sphingorhabdus sp. Alg239-R122 TaxID=2305989 RepID=UPI0013DC9523|nr:TetR/AcrR family transcriptional regulator [Sphingorhabdus sp. Alg239-R122]
MRQMTLPQSGSAREINKEKRKQRILSHARAVIAGHGFEALKLRDLATRANLTVPTIYNLIGGKEEILSVIIEELVEKLLEVQNRNSLDDVEAAFEQQIQDLAELFAKDEDYYRAAFIAGDRSGLFEQSSGSGIFARSVQLPIDACSAAQSAGLLLGNISAEQLGRQIYGSYRLARQDWVHGYFDLEGFRVQALTGIFLCLAADANPEFHDRLINRLSSL